ncbi:hypothetical protein BSKO_10328 [Bryopsis sp. KO-2023]|nr:hypothetical protein BSKO_10328 [Bryopsis sp. KO-2023]
MRMEFLFWAGFGVAALLQRRRRTPTDRARRKEQMKFIKGLIRRFPVGSGHYGTVSVVSCTESGNHFAMKTVKLQNKDADSIEREIGVGVMVAKKKQFLLPTLMAFHNGEKVFIIQEFCKGRSLNTQPCLAGGLPIDICRFLIAQAGLAISYLHGSGVVHLDVKLENLFLEKNGYILLGDFGGCQYLRKHETTASRKGTPEYMGPEVYTGKGVGQPADIWGLGVLLFRLLTGKLPFKEEGDSDRMLAEKIKKADWNKEIILDLGCMPVFDLLSQVFQTNPEHRPDIECFLWHEFFDGMDWDALEDRQIESPLLSWGKIEFTEPLPMSDSVRGKPVTSNKIAMMDASK